MSTPSHSLLLATGASGQLNTHGQQHHHHHHQPRQHQQRHSYYTPLLDSRPVNPPPSFAAALRSQHAGATEGKQPNWLFLVLGVSFPSFVFPVFRGQLAPLPGDACPILHSGWRHRAACYLEASCMLSKTRASGACQRLVHMLCNASGVLLQFS